MKNQKKIIFNIAEAKAKLSKLIELVINGDKVIIARNNKPLNNLVLHQSTEKRKLGLLSGKFSISDNFMDEDAEINKLFYGNDNEIHS